MTSKIAVPKFESETDEANWWYQNRELVSQEFQQAAADGRLRSGLMKRRWEARQAIKQAPDLTVQLAVDDAERAHEIADREGITFQEFARRLFHEALDKHEQAA